MCVVESVLVRSVVLKGCPLCTRAGISIISSAFNTINILLAAVCPSFLRFVHTFVNIGPSLWIEDVYEMAVNLHPSSKLCKIKLNINIPLNLLSLWRLTTTLLKLDYVCFKEDLLSSIMWIFYKLCVIS